MPLKKGEGEEGSILPGTETREKLSGQLPDQNKLCWGPWEKVTPATVGPRALSPETEARPQVGAPPPVGFLAVVPEAPAKAPKNV